MSDAAAAAEATTAVIYGTRPEFLKFQPLITHARDSLKVIRIGQHETIMDGETYDVFIPIPSSGPAADRLNAIGAAIMANLGEHLTSPIKRVIVQGDTATAFYGALVAYQMRKEVVHLEAGMRTYDLENPYPEEGYRQMISRIAGCHLTPSVGNTIYLNAEHVRGPKIDVGNTILDLVRSYNLTVTREPRVLITLHRRENWAEYREYIAELCALAARAPDHTFTLIAHMNPVLQEIICDTCGDHPNLIVSPPMTHKECAAEIARCAMVITDSGGIQEEAAFMGKHIYCIRKKTERDAIPEHYITYIDRPAVLREICVDSTPTHESCHVYGSGQAVEKICRILRLQPRAVQSLRLNN